MQQPLGWHTASCFRNPRSRLVRCGRLEVAVTVILTVNRKCLLHPCALTGETALASLGSRVNMGRTSSNCLLLYLPSVISVCDCTGCTVIVSVAISEVPMGSTFPFHSACHLRLPPCSAQLHGAGPLRSARAWHSSAQLGMELQVLLHPQPLRAGRYVILGHLSAPFLIFSCPFPCSRSPTGTS